jgi:hypothetical protein
VIVESVCRGIACGQCIEFGPSQPIVFQTGSAGKPGTVGLKLPPERVLAVPGRHDVNKGLVERADGVLEQAYDLLRRICPGGDHLIDPCTESMRHLLARYVLLVLCGLHGVRSFNVVLLVLHICAYQMQKPRLTESVA